MPHFNLFLPASLPIRERDSRGAWRGLSRMAALCAACTVFAPVAGLAQTAPANDPPVAAAASLQSGEKSGTATAEGVIVDQSGATIAGARVVLADPDGHTLRETAAGPHGEFVLEHLAAGTYEVRVSAGGFMGSTAALVLSAGQMATIPDITLRAASVIDTVQVNATNEVLAEQQMHAAEKQRVLGLVPNYYTSYDFDAVPMTARQKYKMGFREVIDPISFVGAGVVAGIEQANNTYAGYGQGAAGYGKRYAAAYGDNLFENMLTHAVFPALFRQDPRYFYQGTGTTRSRFVHAISFAVITRSDKGGSVPNYSGFLGDLSAGAISNLYYPHANRGAGLVFTNAAIGIGGRGVGTLVREFVLPYITTHKAGKGMAAPGENP